MVTSVVLEVSVGALITYDVSANGAEDERRASLAKPLLSVVFASYLPFSFFTLNSTRPATQHISQPRLCSEHANYLAVANLPASSYQKAVIRPSFASWSGYQWSFQVTECSQRGECQYRNDHVEYVY
jgi:hypothetical protein